MFEADRFIAEAGTGIAEAFALWLTVPSVYVETSEHATRREYRMNRNVPLAAGAPRTCPTLATWRAIDPSSQSNSEGSVCDRNVGYEMLAADELDVGVSACKHK